MRHDEQSAHVLAQVDGYQLVAGVVHAHTNVSDGELAPSELVQFANRKGLGVVCITDHHFNNWRYRFGIKLDKPSVVHLGISRYFEALCDAGLTSFGPIVVPGIEIMPHYRWEGWPPFLRCEAMKNMVVFGIDDPAVIEQLPARLDGKGKNEREATETAQRVLSYLTSRGGIVYWSHLEEDERFRFLTAEMRYRPRPGLLRQTTGFTGFGCFPQGYREACQPGGDWDQLLADRVARRTYNGPWIIGEADYHSGDRDAPYRNICNPTTIFALVRLDAGDVLAALGSGRMYAYMGHAFNQSVLRTWCVSDSASGRIARSGEVLRCSTAPTVEIAVSGFPAGCSMDVIGAGSLVARREARHLTMTLPRPVEAGYACRAQIVSTSGERIMTNPIFVVPDEPSTSHDV